MKSSSSTEIEDPANAQVLVGVVLGPHGIRGEVAVSVESDNPERFAPGATLTLTFPRRARAGAAESLRVARTIPHKGGLRVSFEGVADRDAAERLRGGELSVPRSEVPPPPRGSSTTRQRRRVG